GGPTQHVGHARRGGHDRVVGGGLLLLVDLVERVGDLVGGAAQEGPRHIALLLVRRRAEVRRGGGGIAVGGEARARLARDPDGVVHDPAPAPELGRHHHQVQAPVEVEVGGGVAGGGHEGVQVGGAPAVGGGDAGRHGDVGLVADHRQLPARA